MKLIRWGNPGYEKTGVIIDEIRYDTSEFGEDIMNNSSEVVAWRD